MLIRDNRPLCYPFDRRMLVSVLRVSAADGEESDATPAGVAMLPGFNPHAITPKRLERYHCAPNVWANVSESPYLADIGIRERRCILTGNL